MARHPSSRSTVLTDHRGHALALGLTVRVQTVLTRWPGSLISLQLQGRLIDSH
jgi:hypothetical protein